jgi:adenylosuccinate lyase
MTSFDVLDTARAIQFRRAHSDVLLPKSTEAIRIFRDRAAQYRDQLQIGRTHGQHALPITVGFWLATILNRILYNTQKMQECADALVGKISGAVGAMNAQVGMKLPTRGTQTFEQCVLRRLHIEPARISTQIVPPEPLAYYLHSCLLLSGALGQFGRDCRNLMRTEIAEIAEPFEEGQAGSSTMAQKRNPVGFEQIEGAYWKNVAEHHKVLFTLISEHQRDLVGSSLQRDFPTIIVNLTYQLDRLLGKGKTDRRPFLERIAVDTEACRRNFEMSGDTILAEPLYLLLQMYGYEGDAHDLVNHQAMRLVRRDGVSLVEAIQTLAATTDNNELYDAWNRIPEEQMQLLQHPARYVGDASAKTLDICVLADAYLIRNL